MFHYTGVLLIEIFLHVRSLITINFTLVQLEAVSFYHFKDLDFKILSQPDMFTPHTTSKVKETLPVPCVWHNPTPLWQLHCHLPQECPLPAAFSGPPSNITCHYPDHQNSDDRQNSKSNYQ
jgi:hypothetical protein